MGDVADLLGTVIGVMLGNPLTIIAGLVISRLGIRHFRFWVEFVIGVGVCVGSQLLLEASEPYFPPLASAQKWVLIMTLAVGLATLVFAVLRKLRNGMRRRGVETEHRNASQWPGR